MFRPCTSRVLTATGGRFRPYSGYVSAVYEVCFDRARGTFRPARDMIRPSSRYDSTVLEVCFDRS